MKLAAFLSDPDAERAKLTIARLARKANTQLVLTGSAAIQLHLLRNGVAVEPRPLNDIDLITYAFDSIPNSLAEGMIFRHVHPQAPPGKLLLQAVDTETAVRVDVFRARGNSIVRATSIDIEGSVLRVISIEDLMARTARLCMDLAHDTPIPAKHAHDFLRLLPLVEIEVMEPIWNEHRKPTHPPSFAETTRLLANLIDTRKDLQTAPRYSRDANDQCSRCKATAAFPLADAHLVLALLGYC